MVENRINLTENSTFKYKSFGIFREHKWKNFGNIKRKFQTLLTRW